MVRKNIFTILIWLVILLFLGYIFLKLESESKFISKLERIKEN